MEDESISSVYITTSQLGDDEDNDEDSNSIAGHKSDSDIMPVIAEVASEIHQFTNSSEEDKGVVEFKAEPSGCSEIGGMELDHFATTVEEVEMGSMMKTEVVGLEEGEQSQDGEAEIVQDAPQQLLILARADGGNGFHSIDTVKFPNGLSSKYIRIDGADGQTYVLAVADDVQEMIQEQSKNTQSHQIASTKNLKVGRKRPASTSTPSATPSPSTASRAKSTHNASTDGVNQAWFTTRDDKNALHSEGHKWKQGQWTKEEVDILEANINSYCKEHNIKDPAEVIFEMSKDERKDFYRTIALGIQRPLFSVYRRVTRMYDRKNHRGKYSSAEMKSLRVLRAKHGNDWAAIGAALGRSASSVKDKCRLMKDNCNSGKWYPEEEARLAAAVYNSTGVKPCERKFNNQNCFSRDNSFWC